MDRAEFMRRLSELLQDVPLAEREEALQYYNDYIDDAGEENEAGVIASLGSPEELAKSVKAGLADGGNAGEFTESGFRTNEQKNDYQVMSTNEKQKEGNSGAQEDGQDGIGQSSFGGSPNGWQNGEKDAYGAYEQHNGAGNKGGKVKSPMSGGQIALIAILAVLTSPIWIGILGGLFGGVVGLFGALLGLFIAFLAVGVVLLVVGVLLIFCGIVGIFGAPLAGFALIGVGLILMALGLVFTCLMVWTVGSVIPALIRGCVNLCNRLFHRGGAKA